MGNTGTSTGSFEDEINRADEAESRVDVIHLERLAHVNDREGEEYRKGDHFLHDLELSEIESGVSDAIRGNLYHVLEERDSPARDRGDVPF